MDAQQQQQQQHLLYLQEMWRMKLEPHASFLEDLYYSIFLAQKPFASLFILWLYIQMLSVESTWKLLSFLFLAYSILDYLFIMKVLTIEKIQKKIQPWLSVSKEHIIEHTKHEPLSFGDFCYYLALMEFKLQYYYQLFSQMKTSKPSMYLLSILLVYLAFSLLQLFVSLHFLFYFSFIAPLFIPFLHHYNYFQSIQRPILKKSEISDSFEFLNTIASASRNFTFKNLDAFLSTNEQSRSPLLNLTRHLYQTLHQPAPTEVPTVTLVQQKGVYASGTARDQTTRQRRSSLDELMEEFDVVDYMPPTQE